VNSPIMPKRTIHVTLKNVYGEERIYPACEHSELLTAMLGQQTFTTRNIKALKELDYIIEIKQNHALSQYL